MWKATGTKPDGLVSPPFPAEITYLWEWFIELNTSRGNSGFGMSPISYTEMYSWCKLKLILMQSWEVDAIRRLDGVFMTERKTKEDA